MTSFIAYPNRQAAIKGEILSHLEDSANRYNINALADKIIDWIPNGYGISYFIDHSRVDFWKEAEACAL